jgi:hypothetical protein
MVWTNKNSQVPRKFRLDMAEERFPKGDTHRDRHSLDQVSEPFS